MSTVIQFPGTTRINTPVEYHSPEPDYSREDQDRLDILRRGTGIVYAEVKGNELVMEALGLSHRARIAEQCFKPGGIPKITGKLRFYPRPGRVSFSDHIALSDEVISQMCWQFGIEQVLDRPEFLIDIWNQDVRLPRESLSLYCPGRNWCWRKPLRRLRYWVLGYGWREENKTAEWEALFDRGGIHRDLEFNRRTGVDVSWYSGKLDLEITPDNRPEFAHACSHISKQQGPDPVERLRSMISNPDSVRFPSSRSHDR